MGEQKELADASRVDAIREHLHEWEREGALDTGKRYALQLLALIDAWATRSREACVFYADGPSTEAIEMCAEICGTIEVYAPGAEK